MRAVNLLPQDMRGAGRGSRARAAADAPGGSGPFWVLGALALSVVAMAAYVFAGNLVAERESELARVTAEQQAAASRAAALKPYGDFQDMAIARTQTVSSLASLRFDWEQALRDVSHALPASVTLTALDGSISTETGQNGGPLRGAIPSPAITLKGCTPDSQGTVATMLSRLKAVRGVTRVSLSKSERIKDAGDGNPCGKNGSPSFEVVTFFERSTASSAPVGASAATAAPSTTPATPAAGDSGTGSQAPAAAGSSSPEPGQAAAGSAQTAPTASTTTTPAP